MAENERELFDFICGERLGYGAYRDVFVMKHKPDLVVKVAQDSRGRRENMVAYKMWQQIDMTPLEKWFAPIIDVSEMGLYLIQKRVEFMPHSQYPKKIPSLFTDVKYSNFGTLDGKFVCCDFGAINLTKGMSTKLVNADWWKDD